MEYQEVCIGYRQGLHIKDELEKLKGFGCIIHIDIKGYYDYVSLENIKDALVDYNFNPAGAKLLGRLNLVDTGKRHSLQQGSHASPVIANLVGHHVWDKPLMDWLKEEFSEGCKYRYVRYSDNLLMAFTFDSLEASKAFKERYIAKVHELCATHRFIAKPADIVPQNHPYRAQKFLGAIINDVVRIDKLKFQAYRALLFNWIKDSPNDFFSKTVKFHPKSFAILNSSNAYHYVYNRQLAMKALLLEVKGFANYVGTISKKQGDQLKNLIFALEMLPILTFSRNEVNSNLFAKVKKYALPIEEYQKIIREVGTLG